MRKIVFGSATLIAVLVILTTIAVLYASGYRLTSQNGTNFVEGTGVIVLTSVPDGARVYVNDHLTTATNNTINLQPGKYDVRIEKEGYFAWKKNITVKKGEVSQANALLFPNYPKLTPLTTTGAANVVVDPTNSLIAYTVDDFNTVRKNGIYLLNMNSRPILLGDLTTQLSDNTVADFTNATLEFSPEGDQIIATMSGSLGTSVYLLSTKNFNDTPQDITNSVFQVRSEWEQIEAEKESRQIRTLPSKLRPFLTTYFTDMSFSPDNNKIMYTASGSATMPIIINPRLKGTNSTPETRELNDGYRYVYDIKEDRNYLIAKKGEESPIPNYLWHPDSNHLVYITDSKINIMEFDGQNDTTVYAGPFEKDFVTIWPDGSNIVILTNFNNPGTNLNLYKVGLK